MVSDGFRWFQVVSDGFRSFRVLVSTDGENTNVNFDTNASRQNTNVDTETNVNFSANKNNVLLQTATAYVSSVVSNRFALTRLIFDSGSQRTCISNLLHEKLRLPSVRKERLVIQTFGMKNNECRDVDVVQLRVKGRGDAVVYVEAICVSEICSPLVNQNINFVAQQHKQNLRLADNSSGEPLTVDVLIGSDYYFWS